MSATAASSPSKNYHVVPVLDVDNEDTLDENDHDDATENASSYNGIGSISPASASMSRKKGRGQYSRIIQIDTQHDNAVPSQPDIYGRNNENSDSNETNSLVLANVSPPSSPSRMNNKRKKGMFRDATTSTPTSYHAPPSTATSPNAEQASIATAISRTSTAAGGTTAIPNTSMTPTSSSINLTSPMNYDTDTTIHTPTGLLLRQGSRGASSTASSVDWDDDDYDDDEVNIRRYHLEYTIGSGFQPPGHSRQQQQQRGNGTDDPLHPTEYGHNTVGDAIRYKIQQLFFHWQSLRQAARQRRAARLLTMPSESMRYKFRACIISWCCDATDMGIALTALCVLMWMLIGFVSSHTTIQYWMLGTAVFVVRISARRCYELCWSIIVSSISNRRQQRGRLGSRQRLGSVDDDQQNMIVSANSNNSNNISSSDLPTTV
jgi:hypothetical protein